MKILKPFILPMLALLSPQLLAAETQCINLKPDLWVDAQYAINGDTIVIQNQRVHLIGLYAPEKERTYKFHTPGEPLAREAQDHLNKLLANNDLKLGIVYDQNRADKNRIQQVHAFFKDGSNLNQQMLRAGFAVNRTENDNIRYADCYYAAEQEARDNGYQLWDQLKQNPQSHFPLLKSSEITSADQGFRIVQGEIVEVMQAGNYYVLNMDTTGIRIPKRVWDKFDYAKLQALQGKTIEVRGYAYLYKGHMYMIVEHPYAFNVFNPLNNSN